MCDARGREVSLFVDVYGNNPLVLRARRTFLWAEAYHAKMEVVV